MNLNKMVKLAAAPALLLLAVGCSKEDAKQTAKDVRQSVSNTAKEPELLTNRKWESDCRPTAKSTIFSKLTNTSEKEFLHFTGNGVEKNIEHYKTKDCQQPLSRIQYTGDYGIKQKVENNTDTRQIDFTNREVSLVPLSEEAVTALKAVNFCGVKEWKANVPQSLTTYARNPGCPVLDVPATQYDIVKVDGDRLLLGTNAGANSKQTPDKRPAQLEEAAMSFHKSDRSFN